MLRRLVRAFVDRETRVFIRNILNLIQQRIQTFVRPLTMSLTISESESQLSPPDPPPFDPKQPAQPVSYPITTLQELQARSFFDSFHYPFNKAAVPIQSGSALSSPLPNRRRLLVCHDMAGGYTDDKYVQGGTNPDAYAIWQWNLIDVFVYFSHSLVALPPPGWTNAAHKHDVKVLGTFITEWDEGKAICNELLHTKESAHMYAERLTELALALGFDGWLINMEVKLEPEQIPNLKEFVNHLTVTMHSCHPGSLVIWYDSVTIEGKLDWQDQLNDKNKPFFDICDGIFVNYTWKEGYPNLSSTFAADRKYDVYMGIDTFGRNTFGGGQWHVDLPLEVLKTDDVSAAIFAPGWVYETRQPPDFHTAQNHWWKLVEKSWGQLRHLPNLLPFYSNFDQGRGYHFSVDGRQLSDTPWFNISSQSFQPLPDFADDQTTAAFYVVNDLKEASYSGGGNLTFKGNLEDNTYFSTRLFLVELALREIPIHITYAVKSRRDSFFGVALIFTSNEEGRTAVLLAPKESKQLSSKFNKIILTCEFTHEDADPGWVLYEATLSMNGNTLKEIHAVCYHSNPGSNKPRFDAKSSGHDTTSYSQDDYFSTLGHLRIRSAEHNLNFLPKDKWLVDGEYIEWSTSSEGSKALNIKLKWKLKERNDTVYPSYNIYVEKMIKVNDNPSGTSVVQEYVGVAHVNCFYVSNLEVAGNIYCLKFIMQACNVDGTTQKIDESPCLYLEAES